MDTIFNVLLNLIKKPKETMVEIINEHTLKEAVVLVVISALCTSFVSCSNIFDSHSSRVAVSIGELVGTLVIWGVSAALWHITAEILGGTGKALELLKTLGFSYFIQVLLIPFYFLAAMMPMVGTFLLAAAGFAITVWSVVLGILAVSSVYGISGARATLVYFVPLLVIIALLIIGLVLLFSMVSPDEYMPLLDEIQML